MINRYGVSVLKMARICSVCRNHNSVVSSFLTYHQVCNKSNRRVQRVEKEMPTLLEHLSLSLVFSGIRVARSFVFYAICGRSLLNFSLFSFGHCIVCPSVYGF